MEAADTGFTCSGGKQTTISLYPAGGGWGSCGDAAPYRNKGLGICVDEDYAPPPAHTSDLGWVSLVRIAKFLYIVIRTRFNYAP